MLRFQTGARFCQSRIHFTLCTINFEMYYYDPLFMNISNYIHDAFQEICEIVTDVRSIIEKADYKKRRITCSKKRNFQLPITETQKSIHQKIERRNAVRVKVYILQMSISQSDTYDPCYSHGKFIEDKFNDFPLTLKELFMREHEPPKFKYRQFFQW